MCSCSACRTGKCACQECREGPGIDFRASHRIHDEVMMAVIRERAKIRDLRAPSPERQRVRRWGDIEQPKIMDDKESEES